MLPGATHHCSGMGWASVSMSWTTVLCITCVSWILFLLLSSFLLSLLLLLLFLLLLDFTSFRLLNCSYLSPWVLSSSDPLLIPPGEGEKWVSSCVVLSYWLGLNHDSPFGTQCGAWRVETQQFLMSRMHYVSEKKGAMSFQQYIKQKGKKEERSLASLDKWV